ncbi:MAG: flagellar basal body protein [Rhodothermus sp.]|nr:flagellar basal body protein [Rhodothermus sp.]
MEPAKLQLLRHAMQAYTWRLKALASNIANLDTPGYQRMSVSFEETLREVRHRIPGLRRPEEVTPRMQIEETPPILENELMELADTQLRTQLTARALRDYFDLMRTAITGRTG